ncbi:hypothetical protein RQ359_001405 [Sulfuracidifex metallicus DSM 6482 = JCM 9184]|uniref:Uncharacterized protein n=2 Tax=Sulfuracidifex metallicus TaxID=47303 RepID=A0A6A9QQK5_SULME|nr:hypothetical protein [Sulfuracidifex metallicus DSM 6482 = JCM 9184]WOE49913.1 hypothetical protein RQ359_001405 [Sulfuracidifex metallicus DSM 6482 = JCM 9184]
MWGFPLPSRLWGDSDKGFKFVKVSFTPEGITWTISGKNREEVNSIINMFFLINGLEVSLGQGEALS